MPITLTRIDECIIAQTWTGHISGEDLIKAGSDQTVLTEQGQFQYLITLIDASETTGIEINIRVLRNVTELESREVAIYVVNPPKIGGMLVKIVGQLIPNKEIRICTSVQEAHQLASAQLQKLKASHT